MDSRGKYLEIKDWDNYKARSKNHCKLPVSLLDDFQYADLTSAEKACFISALMFRVRTGRNLIYDISYLSRVLWFSKGVIERVVASGYLVPTDKLCEPDDDPDVWMTEDDSDVRSWVDTSGYVYVVRSGSLYKIGLSKNPKKRISSLCPPSEATCILSLRSSSPRKLERKLHKLFAHKRSFREWFDLDDVDIEEIRRIGGVTVQ